ncbi:host specificity protein J [Candidatus Puniceispirillum marinum]|nr:phage tail protein [Candidatus Puniceispirillum marinum]
MNDATMISGRGGKSGGGGGDWQVPQVTEVADSIRSSGTARVQFLLSAGPIGGLRDGAKSIFLDDVPLQSPDGTANFEGVGWMQTYGTPDQNPVSMPGFNVVEQVQNTGWIMRAGLARVASRARVDAARLTLRFGRGLVHRRGHVITGAAVTLRIDVWHSGQWHEAVRKTVSEKQSGPFEIQMQVGFSAVDDDITAVRKFRLVRMTANSNSRDLINDVTCTSITWLTWDALRYPGMATVALSLDARGFAGRPPVVSFDTKGRLLAVPRNYDPERRHYNGIWDGQFKTAWSDNPAWVIYDILTARDWGLGLPPESVDKFDLYTIARYCDAPVSDDDDNPRFRFNAVIKTRKSAAVLMAELCAAIHVLFYWSGGRLRFRADKPTAPSILVTSANVINGDFVYHGPARQAEISHAFVTFREAANGGQISVESAVDQDSFQRFGYRPYEVSLLGCTNRAEAQRHARWLIETARSQRHAISYRASLDHFAEAPVRPGDVVLIADPALNDSPIIQARISATPLTPAGKAAWRRNKPDIGKSARLVPLDLADDRGLANMPDQAVMCLYEAGRKKSTGRDVHSPIAHQRGHLYIDAVSMSALLVLATDAPRPRAHTPLVMRPISADASTNNHVEGKPYRVVSVREAENHIVEIGGILHDPDKYARIDAAVDLPALPRLPLPDFSAPLPAATQIRLEVAEIRRSTGLAQQLYITWESPHDARLSGWHVTATAPDGTVQSAQTSAPAVMFDVIGDDGVDANLSASDRQAWRFSIAPISWTSRRGVPVHHHAPLPVPAPTEAVAAPLGLRAIAGQGLVQLRWTAVADSGLAHYEIWAQQGRDSETKLGQTTATAWTAAGLTPGRSVHFRLRYIRHTGQISAFSTPVTATALAPVAGPKGDRGLQGPQGARGARGIQGPKGPKGPQGEGVDDNGIIVAPRIIMPTQKGTGFHTFTQDRKISAPKSPARGGMFTFGPLRVAPDAFSNTLSDTNAQILTFDDPHGANRQDNEQGYFSRFWSRAPKLTLSSFYRPDAGAQPWGDILRGFRCPVEIFIGMPDRGGVMVARAHRIRSGLFDATAYHDAETEHYATYRQFDGIVSVKLARVHVPRPSGASLNARAGYTAEYRLAIDMAPHLVIPRGRSHQPIYIRLRLSVTGTGRLRSGGFTHLYDNFALAGSTLR